MPKSLCVVNGVQNKGEVGKISKEIFNVGDKIEKDSFFLCIEKEEELAELINIK